MGYKEYNNITKDVLDSIKVGDLIKVNDWKQGLKVVGVSDNYAAMIRKHNGGITYSVLEKKPYTGDTNHCMKNEFFHCGTDSWLIGEPYFDYKFNNKETIDYYLSTFETGQSKLLSRNAIAISTIKIKSAEVKDV